MVWCAPKCERIVQDVSCSMARTWTHPNDWAGIFVWILIHLCQLRVSFFIFWYFTDGFKKALYKPSDSGSLEAMVCSPEVSPVYWENLLGRGNDTIELGVSAPRGAIFPEADIGLTYPSVRDNPQEPFLEKLLFPQNVMEEFDRGLFRKTIRIKNLFAEEGLETPFTNPSLREDFRQDCLDWWRYQYPIGAKLLVILTTHFCLSEEGREDLFTHQNISLGSQTFHFWLNCTITYSTMKCC